MVLLRRHSSIPTRRNHSNILHRLFLCSRRSNKVIRMPWFLSRVHLVATLELLHHRSRSMVLLSLLHNSNMALKPGPDSHSISSIRRRNPTKCMDPHRHNIIRQPTELSSS